MALNYGYRPKALRTGKSDNWCQNKNGDDKHCRPTVVLVPIFKMEDAPRNKLYKYQSTAPPNETVISRSKSYINSGFFGMNNEPNALETSDLIVNKLYDKYSRNNPNDVKKRYFNRNVLTIYPEQNGRRSNAYLAPTRRLGSPIQMPPITKRDSIFTRVSKFKLPFQSKHQDIPINNYWINSTRNINIKQVKPRKDFSKAKDLLLAYLEEKKLKKGFSTPYQHNQMNTLVQINKKDFSTPYHDNQMNTLVQINKKDFSTPYHDNQMNALVHDNQMNTLVHDNEMNTLVHSNYNLELNHSVIPNARALLPEPNHENFLALTTTKKGDHKLLKLLESLEREMQNTELNRDLKEMVNAKIRKMYGSVVSDNAMQLKSDRSDILDSLINKLEKKTGSNTDYRDRNLRWNREDDNTFEPTSTPKYDIPLKRNQNAISLYDRPSYKPLKSRFSPVADINHIYDSFLTISKNIYAKDDNYKRPIGGYVDKNSYDMHNDHEISGLDKIKYFQEKQEDLEKKLQSIRNSKHRYELQRESSRKMRPVFIPRAEPDKPRSTSDLQSYYVPDRAKFVHHV